MRLTVDEVRAIKTAATDAFGADTVVRLFGSRVDDTLDGGDVDLHIEVAPRPDIDQQKFALKKALWRTLYHDKIDIIVSQRGGRPRGFERIAYRDGVVL